jgi:hypothetical protein
MAISQQPMGTKRHGLGERPYASYQITKPDGANEVEIGLTYRVVENGKTRWQAESKSKEKSGLFDTHREACEWLIDGPKPAAPKPEVKKTPAKKATPKAPSSKAAPGESAPKAQPEPSLTEKLAATVAASRKAEGTVTSTDGQLTVTPAA